jgi:hypothetical protein
VPVTPEPMPPVERTLRALSRQYVRRVWPFFFLAGACAALAAVGLAVPGGTLLRGVEVLCLAVAAALFLVMGFGV